MSSGASQLLPDRFTATPLGVVVRSWRKLALLAAMISATALLALLVVLDPLLRDLFPFARVFVDTMPHGAPWLVVPALLLIVLLAALLWLKGAALFTKRFEIAIVALLLPGALSGLHAGSIDSFDFAMLIVGAICVAIAMVERPAFLTPPTILAILLGLGACLFASVINGRGSTILGLPSMANKVCLIILLTNLIRTPRLLNVAITAFVTIAVLSALVGLVTAGVYYWTGYEFTFDENEDFHYKQMPFGLMLRATAFLSTPQALSHLLVIALMIVLLAPWRTWIWITLAITLLGGLVATFSTSAYLLTAGVALLAPAIRWPAKMIHYFIFVVAMLLMLYGTGAIHALYELETSAGGDAANDRVDYTRVALTVIEHYPLAGIGLNNFSRALYIPVHNAYLQMTAEVGAIGGGLFAGLVGLLLVRSAIAARCAVDPRMKLYLKGLGLGLLAMAVQFFMEPLYRNVVSWAFMGLVASATALYWPTAAVRGGDDKHDLSIHEN